MARSFLAFVAVLLAGCSTSVLAARPATPSERAAVEALRDAWHAAGRPVPACGPLDRLHVRELADADLQERCGARWVSEASGQPYAVSACYRTGQPWAGAPLRGIVYVLAGLPPDAMRNAVIHEAAHGLMACESAGDTDPGHLDDQVWRQIVPAAQRRAR